MQSSLFNSRGKKGFWSLKDFFKAFILSVSFLLLFTIPDHIIKLFNTSYLAVFYPKSIIMIFLIVAPVIFIKNKYIFAIFSTCLLGLLISGYFYFFHFGRYFSDVDVGMVAKETEDILIALKSDIFIYWYLLLMFAVLVCCLIYIRKIVKRSLKLSNIFIVLFGLSVYHYYNLFKMAGDTFIMPNPLRYMMDNSIKSVYGYFINIFPSDKQVKKFLPYKITKKKDIEEKTNIVLIMGESWSSNHMSLYGYDFKTTPNLDKLKKMSNVVYSKGYSSSVCTTISLSMFFNQQKEPQNSKMLLEKEFNLFKLAKNQGFYTAFISPQGSRTFAGIGMEYIDNSIYRSKDRKNFTKYQDDYSIKKLKELNLKDKNFIVLQTRATHYPYDLFTEMHPVFDKFQIKGRDKRINDYDGAMLYTDNLLKQIIDWSNNLEGKTYLVIISDHGQMLGEDNFWGHGFIDERVGQVPTLFWFKNVDNHEYDYLKSYRYILVYGVSMCFLGRFG